VKIQVLCLPRSGSKSLAKWLNDEGSKAEHEWFSNGNEDWPDAVVVETDPRLAREDADLTLIVERDPTDCAISAYKAFGDGDPRAATYIFQDFRLRKEALDRIEGRRIPWKEMFETGIPELGLTGPAPYLDYIYEGGLKVDLSCVPYFPLRTMNIDMILDVVDELREEVSEDGAEEFIPNVIAETYVEITDGSQTVCLFRVIPSYRGTYEFHILCRKPWRSSYLLFWRICLEWLYTNREDLTRLEAKIPVVCKTVLAAAEAAGFKREGIARKSIQRGGELVDVIHFGIIDEEMRRNLWELQLV
jgi:hypothetical protein